MITKVFFSVVVSLAEIQMIVIIIQAQKSLLSLLSHRSLLSLLSLHHRRVNKLYPLIYKKGYSNGLLEQNEGKGKGEPGPPGLP